MTAEWVSRTVRAAVFAAVCVLLAALGHVLMSGSGLPGWTLAAGAVATGGAAWCLAGTERGLLVVVSATVAAQAALHSTFTLAQTLAAPAQPGGSSLATRWMQDVTCGAVGGGGGGGTGSGSGASVHDMGAMSSMTSMTSMPSMSARQHMEHMGDMGHMGHMGHGADMGHGMGMDHGMDMGHGMGMNHDMGGMSPTGMLAAHLLAALVSGLWLAYGERAAFRIARAFAGWLVAPLRVPLVLPAPPHRPRIRVRRTRSHRAVPGLLLVHAITSRGPPMGTAVI
ncbi:hypothetical protein ACQB60_24030 [Actinomycetota bacterium Odt1-20B]